MKDVIRVEFKRILNKTTLNVILLILVTFAIFKSVEYLADYKVLDRAGNLEISAMENLRESKKHRVVLNKENLENVINRTDTSKYLYNLNLVRIVLANYPTLKMDEITNKDIEKFYELRFENIINIIDKSPLKYSQYQKEYLLSNVNLEETIEFGYAKGWLNINKGLEELVILIAIMISILLIGLFSEDPKIKIEELYLTTKKGRKSLLIARIFTGYLISNIIYIAGVIIFSVINFIIYGVEGFDLKIQSSLEYFFSIIDITFLEQYIINLFLGFCAILLLVSIIYILTISVKQILPAGVLISFMWVLMLIVPSKLDMKLRYFILNFMPYNMANFQEYYITNEIYTLGTYNLQRIEFVSIISIFVAIVLIIISFLLYRKRKKRTHFSHTASS
ncbi:MAG: hypothetical protein ACRC41_03425 [Sarcina sp.]